MGKVFGKFNQSFVYKPWHTVYSSLTLVLAFCGASYISPKNEFSSFLTLYIIPHTLKASLIWEGKGKIHEKLVTHFFLVQISDGNEIQDVPKLTGYWLSDTGIG